MKPSAPAVTQQPLPAVGDVMIVEDDLTAALLLTSIVQGMGHEVRAATTAAEARRAVTERRPDLVLLDLGLPDMDGRALAAELRGSHALGSLPIIVVSGDDDPTSRVEAFDAGVVDFVSKPYNIAEVRARVGRQLELLWLRRALEEANLTLEDQVAERTRDLRVRMAELTVEISRREELERRLRRLADTDPLTDLLNRRGLRLRLEARLRDGQRTMVIAMELDGWDSIVGLRGDRHGDAVLTAFAQRLEEIASSGLVACLGRNQFVLAVSMPDDVSPADLDCLRQQLERPLHIDQEQFRLSVSLGAATTDGAEAEADALLRDARLALHDAKAKMAGAVLLAHDGRRQLRKERALEEELWGAAARGELRLRFQPVLSAQSGRMESVEALVRWRHPLHGEIGPDTFIPLAERSGAISEIGTWTVHEACSQLARWRASNAVDDTCTVAVNLSALEVMDENLATRVRHAVEQVGLLPADVKLELTETAIVSRLTSVRRTLTELRLEGFEICLDDFGTGYSSLTMLREIPASVVKIDRSFVRELGEHPASSAIVEATIALAHRLGQRVIAEGVETESQLRALVASGCDALQGYLLAPPLDPDEIAAGVGMFSGLRPVLGAVTGTETKAS